MSHLTEQDRCKIQNLLNAGDLPREIAFKIGKNPSTIQREIRKHRHEDETNQKHIRNFCSQRKQCCKRSLCKLPPPNCPGRCSVCKIFSCNKLCSSFTEDSCEKLNRSPYVCNGCHELKGCQNRKYFYIASTAMNEYLTLLPECRQGIDVSPVEIQQYNDLIKTGGKNGQGIHHIMAAHPDIFQKCEKTIYNYYNNGLFSLPRGDMPRMCMRKPRRTPKIRHKIDSKCRQGRTLNDYNAFKATHPDLATAQMDSVIGRVGGKVLMTLQFEFGLMLACLRDTNNSQSVIDYFDMLERKFGFSQFQKMFPVILTDNGSEFSNPTAIETSPISKKQRTKVFYCDPNASWQKGNIENNHTNLRRILEKKTSFDNLAQSDIDLVLSHLNSYIRKSYQDIPAITRFNSIFGYDILEQLHISLIDPDKVIMEPKLLRGKI